MSAQIDTIVKMSISIIKMSISNLAGMGATMLNKNTTDAPINSIEVIPTIAMAGINKMNSIIEMNSIIGMISIIKTINSLLMM